MVMGYYGYVETYLPQCTCPEFVTGLPSIPRLNSSVWVVDGGSESPQTARNTGGKAKDPFRQTMCRSCLSAVGFHDDNPTWETCLRENSAQRCAVHTLTTHFFGHSSPSSFGFTVAISTRFGFNLIRARLPKQSVSSENAPRAHCLAMY